MHYLVIGATGFVRSHGVTLALAIAAIAVVISTIPFVIAAIDYRQRDNGLAFLLLVSGVGVWNAMFVAQLLSPEPLIQVFFLALSVVGAVQAGLGFFLFATTASSTPNYLSRRSIYAAVSVLAGLNIVFAVTAPVHGLYWDVAPVNSVALGFAVIDPGPGYWFHTLLLVALFGAGAMLFLDAWRARPGDPYPPAYVVTGVARALAILASNLIAPGGLGVAPIVGASLTSVGWLQASRG